MTEKSNHLTIKNRYDLLTNLDAVGFVKNLITTDVIFQLFTNGLHFAILKKKYVMHNTAAF